MRNDIIVKWYSFYIAVAMVLALSGCIEEYEADIPADESNLLVVEGTICSARLNRFTLTRSQPIHSTPGARPSPLFVTGASISVHGSDGTVYTAQATGDYYTCQVGALSPDADYWLHIEADGEVYESEPQRPLRTEAIADVSGSQNTPESNIDVLVTPAEPFEPDKTTYYSWTYDETWEVHPDYTTVLFYDIAKGEPVIKTDQFPKRGWKDATGTTQMVGNSTSYEGQHIRRLKLYDLERSNERMYYRYSGLIHQRAISKAEYEYELARQQASTEMGGLFTPQPSALPTNIRCLTSKKHVIGFVGCSLNTSEYRFFFDYSDFSVSRPQPSDKRLWIDNPDAMDCTFMVVYRGMFLCEWIDPKDAPDGMLHTAWAYDYQLDVRCNGAYIEKPEFWNP